MDVSDNSVEELDRLFKEESNLRRFGTRAGDSSQVSKREIDAYFQECDQDIKAIEQSLTLNAELTQKMVSILDSFENRLSQLKDVISPIHSDTMRLKNIHTNIESSLQSIGEVLEIFEIGNRVEQRIKEGFGKMNPTEFDTYLECLDKISEAINYIISHKNYKSAEKGLLQLKGLRETGIHFCDQAFAHIIIRDSIVVDLTKYMDDGVTLPAQIELMKPEGIKDMKKLIKRFSMLGATNYLKEYKEKRGKMMVSALRKLAPEKIVKEEAQGKAHPHTRFVRIAMMLIRNEYLLASDMIPNEYFESMFFDLISGSIELLIENCDAIIKAKRNVEKGFGVFALIDIWAYWRDAQQENADILKCSAEESIGTRLQEEISELITKLNINAKKCFEDFELYVKSDNKPLPPDGTVHELTSNVCVYFRRLFPFKDRVELLLTGKPVKGKQTALGDFIIRNLGELRNNLSGKAKKQKEVILSTIFLLNNFHYIQKTIQTSELWALIGNQQAFLSEYEKATIEQRDIYKASWKPAIDNIKIESRPKDPLHLSSKEKKSIKNKFAGFNEEYEKMFDTQKHYFIPDEELRKTIRDDIQMLLAEPYGRFYNSFSQLGFSKNKGKYVRYSYETVVGMLKSFFEGSQAEGGRKSKLFQFS